VSFLVGVLLADSLTLPWQAWLILAGVALVAAALLRLVPVLRQRASHYLFLVALSLLGLCLGGFRYQITPPNWMPSTSPGTTTASTKLVITGMVDAPPDVRDTYTNLQVSASTVDTGRGN